jgi:hypothetical protein
MFFISRGRIKSHHRIKEYHMNYILPATTRKVPMCTDEKVNAQIRQQSIQSIGADESKSDKALAERIEKLDREWDTERFLETNASLIIFAGSLIGILTRNYYWFLLPGFISFFLLQHALLGWCPPLPLIRKAGIRTAEEICREKTALKVLRGDFGEAPLNARMLIEIVEKQ